MFNLMKKMIVVLLLGTALGVAGCSGLLLKPTPTVEQVKANPKQVAQDQINQINLAIAAAANTVTAGYKAEIYTKDEKESLERVLVDAREGTKAAKKLLDNNDVDGAAFRANLVKKAVDELTAYLVKQSNKEKGNK